MQLIANVLREDQLLQTAYAYEQATDWHKQTPQLS
jgi:aspartyl-tRNA(Asn)/glutamyl-tRNA(Gln) amidotransferase subunit A